MKILITGCAGFIGHHLTKRLLADDHEIVGIDSINDYYDVGLKYARLAELGGLAERFKNFEFIRDRLENDLLLKLLFEKEKFDIVINLAAQAGVRHSLIKPHSYIDANIVGFLNILECCRNYGVKHLLYASSSSVYGNTERPPSSINDKTDSPLNLYAATKKANELMAYAYSHLFNFSTTGMRFFTVYGPWGRPDMALFIFAKAMLADEPIKLFNKGEMYRDFTYIDDLVSMIKKIVDNPPKGPYQIYNLGSGTPKSIQTLASLLHKHLNILNQKIELLDMQPGDVQATFADMFQFNYDFEPVEITSLDEGVRKFVEWYKTYYS